MPYHCVRMLISSLQNGGQLLFKEALEIVFLILNEKISEYFPSNMFNAVLIKTAKIILSKETFIDKLIMSR